MGIGFVVMVIVQIMTLIFFPNTVYHDPYGVLSQADQMAAISKYLRHYLFLALSQ